MADHFALANLIAFYIFLFNICSESYPNQLSNFQFENFNRHYVQQHLDKSFPKLGNETY